MTLHEITYGIDRVPIFVHRSEQIRIDGNLLLFCEYIDAATDVAIPVNIHSILDGIWIPKLRDSHERFIAGGGWEDQLVGAAIRRP